jgi:hypothetical protein
VQARVGVELSLHFKGVGIRLQCWMDIAQPTGERIRLEVSPVKDTDKFSLWY